MLVSCLGPRLGGEIMGLRGLIMGLRGLIWGVQELIWGLRGLILSSRDQISGPSRLDEGLRPLKGGDGRKDGQTDGRTYGNSPLCSTRHRPFGATALLSPHYLETATEQCKGYR